MRRDEQISRFFWCWIAVPFLGACLGGVIGWGIVAASLETKTKEDVYAFAAGASMCVAIGFTVGLLGGAVTGGVCWMLSDSASFGASDTHRRLEVQGDKQMGWSSRLLWCCARPALLGAFLGGGIGGGISAAWLGSIHVYGIATGSVVGFLAGAVNGLVWMASQPVSRETGETRGERRGRGVS